MHQPDVLEPLVPGEPVTLTFSLTPSAFAEGFVYFSLEAPPDPARNTLHHGGDQTSYLEIALRR